MKTNFNEVRNALENMGAKVQFQMTTGSLQQVMTFSFGCIVGVFAAATGSLQPCIANRVAIYIKKTLEDLQDPAFHWGGYQVSLRVPSAPAELEYFVEIIRAMAIHAIRGRNQQTSYPYAVAHYADLREILYDYEADTVADLEIALQQTTNLNLSLSIFDGEDYIDGCKVRFEDETLMLCAYAKLIRINPNTGEPDEVMQFPVSVARMESLIDTFKREAQKTKASA